MPIMGAGRTAPVAAVIVGAGVAGRLVLEEIRNRPGLNYVVRGFVDDNEALHGTVVNGIPVLGGSKDLPRIKDEQAVVEAIIAMPSVRGQSVRKIVDLCRQAGLTTQIIPGAIDVLSGRATVSAARPVGVEDLLRRETLVLANDVEVHYSGKIVLVTGAAGTIGSELCRALAGLNLRRLVLFDTDENGVFDSDLELRSRVADMPKAPEVVPVVGSILNEAKVEWLFATYRPDIVFHAAARKHVPMMENHPEEAVETNVLGTRIVAEKSLAHKVETFVHISTDKAVEPSSVMGATKRLSEVVVRDLARRSSETKFVIVRFGNVIGSRSSVFDVFRRQLARGGPITLTHPGMTRYFMTANEAAVLLLHAVVIGASGNILSLDMGEPIRIADLAKDLITLSGYRDEDIEIRFVGPRPGEKLHERLHADDETLVPTRHPRILRVDGVVDPPVSPGAIERLAQEARIMDRARIRHALRDLLPTYRPGFAGNEIL